VAAADLPGQHLGRAGLVNRAVDCLPLNIGQYLRRHPRSVHRRDERRAYGPPVWHREDLRDHDVAGVVVDPGDLSRAKIRTLALNWCSVPIRLLSGTR
jgi:hypothetical protein